MIERVQTLVRNRQIWVTLHARREMDEDEIPFIDLCAAILSDESKIIEDYPEDVRGHSHLVLGFTPSNEPIHVVCAVHEEELVIITTYRPIQGQWINWRIRK